MTEETATAEVDTSESLLDTAEPVDLSTKPEDMPDDFWDAEKNAVAVDKLYEAYKQKDQIALGLRQKLSRGEFTGKAPEDVNEYKLELDESLKAIVPDDDPLLAASRQAAKEAGLPADIFAKFVTPIIAKIAESQPQQPTEEEIKAEQAAYRAAEMEKLGPSAGKIAASVKGFISELGAKGVLMEDDIKEIQASITTAGQLRAFNRLRSYMGVGDVPVNVIDASAAASKAELESKLVEAASKGDEVAYNAIRDKLVKIAS